MLNKETINIQPGEDKDQELESAEAREDSETGPTTPEELSAHIDQVLAKVDGSAEETKQEMTEFASEAGSTMGIADSERQQIAKETGFNEQMQGVMRSVDDFAAATREKIGVWRSKKEQKIMEEKEYPFGSDGILHIEAPKNARTYGDEIKIQIRDKEGNVLVDLADLLPEKWKLTIKKRPDYSPDYPIGADAHPDDKEIGIPLEESDFKEFTPKRILTILHEIGHARTIKYGKAWRKAPGDSAELMARCERAAWAEALKIVRDVRREQGVNLLAPWDDMEDVKHWIHNQKLTGFLAKYGPKAKELFVGKGYADDFFTDDIEENIRKHFDFLGKDRGDKKSIYIKKQREARQAELGSKKTQDQSD